MKFVFLSINRSSAFAGFTAAFFALPFDNAKTKMQKMKRL